MPKLIVTLPDGSDVTHELTDDVVTVGRVSDNVIQIDDASVSSHHAQLSLNGSDYTLQDTGSTNGTRFNGKQISPEEEHRLQDGDKIRFGSIEVSYVSETAAEQRPMPAEEGHAISTASSSARPADFSNASPFQTKKKKKDPAATVLLVVAIVGFVAFAGAVASAFALKSPL